jgi:hypothetical protein
MGAESSRVRSHRLHRVLTSLWGSYDSNRFPKLVLGFRVADYEFGVADLRQNPTFAAKMPNEPCRAP